MIETAQHFHIPLWYVELNEISYEKGIEWFYIYEEGK